MWSSTQSPVDLHKKPGSLGQGSKTDKRSTTTSRCNKKKTKMVVVGRRAALKPPNPNPMQLFGLSHTLARRPACNLVEPACNPFCPPPCREAPDAPRRPLHSVSRLGEVQRSGETWIGGRGGPPYERLSFFRKLLRSLSSFYTELGLFWLYTTNIEYSKVWLQEPLWRLKSSRAFFKRVL